MVYGQYVNRTGCYENGYAMPEDRESFMGVLTQAGYRTHGIGKCHFTRDKYAMRGFETREIQEEIPTRASDDYTKFLEANGWGDLAEPHGVRGEMYYIPQVSQLPQKYHPTQWIGDRSVAFIEEQRDESRPWYLFSSFIHPHPAFAPPAPWHKLYRAPNMPLPKVPQDVESLHTYINKVQNRYKYRDQGIDQNLLRNMKAHYYACISFIDYQVGRILDALEQTGQLENTLILFTADHGEHLGDYNCFGKRSMHDTASRVPLLVRQPGRFEGGKRCDEVVNLVDIMPTFLAAAGVSTDQVTDGVDLHDVLTGKSDRTTVHCQHHAAGRATYTAVSKKWKYTYSAPDDQEFLFDRRIDPGETRNRAAIPMNAATLAELRRETIAFLRDMGEADAIDGDGWKKYPVLDVPSDPDADLILQDTPGYEFNVPGYTDVD
jgi:arylsulfatase A-like enzyme